LADAAADFVLMFLSFHHVPDRAAATREIARVLKPGGRLILRTTFRERIPDLWWRTLLPPQLGDRGGGLHLGGRDARAVRGGRLLGRRRRLRSRSRQED
jgi:SAM-dependent methyltransferase